jgi:hypothetical protein
MAEPVGQKKVPGCLAKGCIYSVAAFFVLCAVVCSGDDSPQRNAKPKPAPKEVSSEKPQAPESKTKKPDLTPFGDYKAPDPVDAVTATKDAQVWASVGGEKIGILRRGSSVKYAGETGEFFEVYVFSGESRYLKRSDGVRGKVTPRLPDSESVQRAVFRQICDAEEKANRKADPYVNDIKAMANVQRLAIDELKLKEMGQAAVSPLDADEVSMKGVLQKWPPIFVEQ